MAHVVLLTGGNIGDIGKNIVKVKTDIERCIGKIKTESAIYRSKAWEFESADEFLNQVLVVETDFNPFYLLEEIHKIEQQYGRERSKNETKERVYSSRTMDIDILFYDNAVIESEKLSIPHPRIRERKFVLDPLNEIIPDYVHPILKTKISNLIKNI